MDLAHKVSVLSRYTYSQSSYKQLTLTLRMEIVLETLRVSLKKRAPVEGERCH